ncbi:MAG: nucleoside deaminase [Chloroflexota bacterium]|nr:MAG: nucleoside deaminase [Chloroflexota bacterium]
MTELRPGTSPPPVRIPMRRGVAMRGILIRAAAARRLRLGCGCGEGWTHGPDLCVGHGPAPPTSYHPTMNYELYMGEALAEARAAVARGERPHAAVAVLDEAMVARGHDRVVETNDPTAHAVIVALREAARRLNTSRLQGVTIFVTKEPCAMCVGALLNSDVDALVYAAPNPEDGAAGTVVQLVDHPGLGRRLKVVSGIRRDEADELYASTATAG